MVVFDTFKDDKVATEFPADNVVPPTVKLFWMVAADTVRSPLIVVSFKTLRDEIVVTAAAADMDIPPSVRLV